MTDGLHLGDVGGLPFCLPLDALTTMTAIIGRRGSGKTTTALVLAEEYIGAGLPVVLLDPLGVAWGLRSSADGEHEGLPVLILGGAHGDLPLEPTAGAMIADLVVERHGAYIIDFSSFESRAAEKRFATDFAERLYRAKAHESSALGLIVDEADTFAPQQAQGDDKRMLGAFEAIARRGRVRGLGMVAITQRPAVLNKNVLSQSELLIAHQVTAPQDREALKAWAVGNATPGQVEAFLGSLASLQVGQAWLWSPAWLEIFERINVRRRRTFDSSRTPKAGEVRIEPRVFADVELEELRSRMTATIERAKADDPKALRDRIQRLESDLQFARDAAANDQEMLAHSFTGGDFVKAELAKEKGERTLLARSAAYKDQEIARLNRELFITRDGLAEAIADVDRLEAALQASTDERDWLRRQVEEIASMAATILQEEAHAQPRADSPRSDRSDKAAGKSARKADSKHEVRVAPRSEAATSERPDKRNGRSGGGVGALLGGGRPGRMAERQRRARGAGRDTEDMKDEEVRDLVKQMVREEYAAAGSVLVVPPAEVLRQEYQHRAVERIMERVRSLDEDEREVLLFLLGQPETWMSINKITVAITGNDSGSSRERWGKVTAGLVSKDMVSKGGSGGMGRKPRLREWVLSELAAHGSSDAEVEEVYQAVLGRIAGGA